MFQDSECIFPDNNKKKKNKKGKIAVIIGLFILAALIAILIAIKLRINEEQDGKRHIPELLEDDKTLVWMENHEPGVIKKLQAHDLNENSTNQSFTYELNPSKNDDTIKNSFNLSSNGILSAKVFFNYDLENTYNISLLITNNIKPKKTVESSLSVHIKTDRKLEFLNVKKPLFINHNHIQYFNSSPLLELKLKNKNNRVKFNLTSGNAHNYFRLDPEEGKIYTNDLNNSSLKRDEECNLTITATDGILSATETFRIIIRVNNNGPEFKKFVDKINIVVDKNYGDDCLTTVLAVDPDIEEENVDHKIRYGISEEQYFKIDDSGCIKLKQVIKKNQINEYNVKNLTELVIRAFDNGLQDGHRETKLRIIINLIDSNKKRPDFQLELKEFFTDEDAAPGSIGQLRVARCDENSENFKFSINTSKKLGKEMSECFNITEDGELNSRITFQWKEKSEYQVPIVITDAKSSDSSEAILKIRIIRNKSKFQFSKARYFANIYSDNRDSVLQVQTLSFSCFDVNLTILSGNIDNLFKFEHETLMNDKLDGKNLSKYTLEIQAECEGSMDRSFVDIFVMKSGENGLVFDPPHMDLAINRSNLDYFNNHCLAQVQAHVRDNATEQVVSYGGDEDGLLDVDGQGCLMATPRLRSQIKDNHPDYKNGWVAVVKAFVSDDGKSLRNGNTTISIKLI